MRALLTTALALLAGISACSRNHRATCDGSVDLALCDAEGQQGRKPDAGAVPNTALDAASGVALVLEAGAVLRGLFDARADVLAPSAECRHPPVEARCSEGMCQVPPGCFVMGAPRDEPLIGAVSDRQIEVRLTHGFAIGETEVTRAQWLALGLPDPAVDWRVTGSADAAVPPPGYSLCTDPTCPVLWVGYEDAMSYANLLSERAGLAPCYVLSDCRGSIGRGLRCRSVRVAASSPYECDGYRLPTEAEWEYAARAGTQTAFYSGPVNRNEQVSENCGLDENLGKIGWYCGNSGGTPGAASGHAHPVAQKLPNAWGLYDMSGNAFEWVNDLHDPLGYGDKPLLDPLGGVITADDLTPSQHPVWGDYQAFDGFPGARGCRGGAFDLWSSLAKSSRRFYGSIGGQHSSFRIIRTIRESPP